MLPFLKSDWMVQISESLILFAYSPAQNAWEIEISVWLEILV